MSEKKQSYIGWYVLAAIIILFAFSAPYIFTRKGIIDFTETGQIGDTIGGTMGPFIAIAGVIVTFLAFLMQKKANDIISEQHEDDKKREDAKLQNEYSARVELLKSDIDHSIRDIEQRTTFLEEHENNLSANPFRTLVLKETSTDMYRRMSNSNRDSIFIALTELKIDKPEKILQKYYSISDYFPSAVSATRRIADDLSNETHVKLKEIGENIALIYAISIRNGWLNFRRIDCIANFYKTVQESRSHESGKEMNFMKIWTTLPGLEKSLNELVNSNYYRDGEQRDLIEIMQSCQKSILLYNDIQNGAIQVCSTIKEIIKNFNFMLQRCNELKNEICVTKEEL